MIRLGLFVMIALIVAFITLLGQEKSSANGDDRLLGQDGSFKPVNPPEWCQDTGKECYIWTPKDVYLADEPIPIYIEFVIKDESLTGGLLHNPAVYDDELRIKKERYGFLRIWPPYMVGCHDDIFWRSRGDFVPSEDEIDLSRLHGRLKMPTYYRKPLDLWVLEDEENGDCYVVMIKDIRTFCGEMIHAAELPFFDLRGVYKVQYMHSNIIEFEIR